MVTYANCHGPHNTQPNPSLDYTPSTSMRSINIPWSMHSKIYYLLYIVGLCYWLELFSRQLNTTPFLQSTPTNNPSVRRFLRASNWIPSSRRLSVNFQIFQKMLCFFRLFDLYSSASAPSNRVVSLFPKAADVRFVYAISSPYSLEAFVNVIASHQTLLLLFSSFQSPFARRWKFVKFGVG